MLCKTQLVIKRCLDIVVCTVLLVSGLPFLLIFALLVRSSSVGPVFFVQIRVGKNAKPYKIIKFRTMVGEPDENATCWSKSDEARVTRIRRFMRDYGFDEIPQLLNILKGDMSIIGPRSPLPQQVNSFSSHHKKMFRMRPGVLCLAGIYGRRSLTMEQRYDFHVEYVETWSLKLDLKILWQSLFVVLRREDANETLPRE